MENLKRFVVVVDKISDRIGRLVSWLTLATVVICFGVVVLRYVFSIGFVWMQEFYVWLHAIVFMGGAAFTLLHGGHVRVDIFYNKMSPRRQAWVDLMGVIVFLMPYLAVIAIWSWAYVAQSWQVLEASQNSQGMHGLFLLKTVILVYVAMLAVQALAMAGKSILKLMGVALPPGPAEAKHAVTAS
ncbi:MAG: TRAP transporter small permease subunit [Alphaproteobacteria bacterium]